MCQKWRRLLWIVLLSVSSPTLVSAETTTSGWSFLRGDVNGNGSIGIDDPITLVSHLFLSGGLGACEDAADVNDDGVVAIDDVVLLLGYAFAMGTQPAAPFPNCAVDPTADDLTCDGPVVGCPGFPDHSFAYSGSGSPTRVLMHPASASVSAGEFDEKLLGMRPLTLAATTPDSPLAVQLGGDDVLELYLPDGTIMSLPAVIDAAELPLDVFVHATAPGDSTLTTTDLTTGTSRTTPIVVRLFQGLAGKDLPEYPWFEYVRTVNEDDQVQTALDPNRYADRVGQPYDVYIVDHRSPAEWAADATLFDVTGGHESTTLSGQSITDNVVDAWTTNLDGGDMFNNSYDVVFDFGLDGTLDPGDLIAGLEDGEGAAGLYVSKSLLSLGPHTTTSLLYSGGIWLGQKVYYPADIDQLGEVPLVVISHGNGHLYTWYDYLGDHLASHGYVVMSHENNTAPGIESASTTTLTNTDYFLQNLATIATGALDGHVDASRICWIGHSRGGEGVVRAYDRIVDGDFVPAEYTADNIFLISSIAPTVFLSIDDANPHDVNYHLIAGAADGDVSGSPELLEVQFLRIHQKGTGNTSATYVHGASHNDFNCCGFDDGAGPGQIGRIAAQDVAMSYYTALLEYYARGNLAAKDFLVRHFKEFHPHGIAGNVKVANQWKDPSRVNHVIEDFQSEDDTSIASTGQPVAFDVNNLVEGRLDDDNVSFTWSLADPMNGMTQAETPNDESKGNIFDWNSGEQKFIEYTIDPTENDWRDDHFLTFRACLGTRHVNSILSNPLTFTVTIEDSAGATSSINFGSYGGLSRPYSRGGAGYGLGWANEYNLVRLRIVDFENDGSAIDLAHISALRFEFGSDFGSSKGRVGFDDVQLTKD